MYRSKLWRVSTPAVGALGVFVWFCALGVTAEAFDKPTVGPTAAAQSVQGESSAEPAVAPEGAPVEVRPPTEATRSTMAGTCESTVGPDCIAQIGIQGFALQEFPNAGMCWDLDGDTMCDLDFGACVENVDCTVEGSTCIDNICTGEDVDGDGDCDIADCGWTGLAFPFIIGDGVMSVDRITFRVNSNFAGGDIYLTGASETVGCGTCPWDASGDGIVAAFDLAILLGNWGTLPKDAAPEIVCLDANGDGIIAAIDLANLLGNWGDCPVGFGGVDCQPDIFDMRRMLGCAVSGLTSGVQHDLNFEAFATTPGETIWAIFVGRSGLAGVDALGFYTGLIGTGHQVARSDVTPSVPGNSFANVTGTGNAGDWDDLHTLGDGLGTFYCVQLSSVDHGAPATFDCVANPDPVGGCCGLSGFDCHGMRGFECGAAGGVYAGDGSTCTDCFSSCGDPLAGDCCEPAGNGSPGCEERDCCQYVCGEDGFCCSKDWDDTCAQKANDIEVGCGQFALLCQPTNCTDTVVQPTPRCIQSGTDYTENGTLGFALDEYGAWASSGWSGGEGEGGCEFGDKFKPVGFLAKEGVFGNALFVYLPDPGGDPELDRRAICSGVPNHVNTYPVDIGPLALFPEIPTAGQGVLSDTDADGVDDTMTSQFILCHELSDIALTFDVTQHVERVAFSPGVGVGVLTQVYNIKNTSDTAIDFSWIRQVDSDLLWIGDAGDDTVGTTFNTGGGDVSVFTAEHNRPTTAVTLSSPQGAFYYGGKGDFDPDGVGECVGGFCVGGPHDLEACDPLNCPDNINADVPECVCSGGPIFGCGTDFQQWNGFGLPEAWANYIANVGHNTDGESGGSPDGCNEDSGGCSCDGSIGVGVEISLEPGASTCVCIQYTYGQTSPWMGGTCPEGCNTP